MAGRYGWYAERYGWTPQQVDEMPAWVAVQFPVYAATVDQAKATLTEEAARKAEQQRAR